MLFFLRIQELKRRNYPQVETIKERENGLKAKYKKAKARLAKKSSIQEGSHDTL